MNDNSRDVALVVYFNCLSSYLSKHASDIRFTRFLRTHVVCFILPRLSALVLQSFRSCLYAAAAGGGTGLRGLPLSRDGHMFSMWLMIGNQTRIDYAKTFRLLKRSRG